MKRHDSDDSPVAAKSQRFDLSGKALYKNQIIIIIIIILGAKFLLRSVIFDPTQQSTQQILMYLYSARLFFINTTCELTIIIITITSTRLFFFYTIIKSNWQLWLRWAVMHNAVRFGWAFSFEINRQTTQRII